MAKTFKTIALCALALCLCTALSLSIGTIKVSANEAVKFDGAYVTLSDGIAAKFKFKVPDGYTKATAVFNLEGEEQPTEKTLDVKTGEAIVAYDGLNPAQIDKKVSLALTLSGNEKTDIVGNTTFTVSEYLDTLLTAAPSAFAEIKTQSQYVTMRALAANLVNYSAKAKLYLNETDNVSSLLKTEIVKNYIGTAVPVKDDKDTGTIENGAEYGIIGAKLLLGEKVNVAFSFVAKEEGVQVKVTLGGNATTVEASEDTSITVNGGLKAYSAVYRGLSVTEFGKTMTAKLVKDGNYIGNTVKYSVASYVYSMQTVGDEKMKALATAVYNYGLSAEKYTSEMAKDYISGLPTQTVEEDIYSSSASASAKTAVDWAVALANPLKVYAHSLTAHNGYFYYLAYNEKMDNTDGMSYLAYNIVKTDISGKVIGYSKEFNGPKQKGTGEIIMLTPLWIKDGYVYSFNEDKKTIRVEEAKLTGQNVDIEVANDFTFGNIAVSDINAVLYNSELNRFAVTTGKNTIKILDGDNLTNELKTITIYGYSATIGGDENAFVVLNHKDGNYQPEISVYNWNGDKVDAFTASIADIGLENSKNSKPNGVTVYNGKVYYQLITWDGMQKTAIFEVSKQRVVSDYAVGNVFENYVTETQAKSLTNGWSTENGSFVRNAIEKDGWIYLMNDSQKLVRFNPVTGKKVAESQAIVGQIVMGRENVAMFAYNGRIYVYNVTEGKWNSLPLRFNATDKWKSVDCPVKLGDYASTGKFDNVYVFEDSGNIAVYKGTTITLLNANGAKITSYTVESGYGRMSGGKDGYIYFTVNAQGAAKPKVIIIDTKTNIQTAIELPCSLENPSKSIITSIFELNGTLCYSSIQWSTKNASDIEQVEFTVKGYKTITQE